eukprot:3567903-Rhodomonas_salina.3
MFLAVIFTPHIDSDTRFRVWNPGQAGMVSRLQHAQDMWRGMGVVWELGQYYQPPDFRLANAGVFSQPTSFLPQPSLLPQHLARGCDILICRVRILRGGQ